MRNFALLIFIAGIFSQFVSAQNEIKIDKEFPELKGEYFGLEKPGLIPKVFAPGIVSETGRYEYGISFSPKLDEVYFSVQKENIGSKIYFSKIINNAWTKPRDANFTKGKKESEMEAFFSQNGEKIFFTAYDSMNINIWFVEKKGEIWSEANKLESTINDDIVFYSNTATNGDMYYTNISKRKIYYATAKDGKYPEKNDAGISFGIHGFISPNQDFILLDNFKDNDKKNKRDIFVCFKKKNKTWTDPINLGQKVNSDFGETCPCLSPDGRFLFFSRYNEEGELSDIYWVDAKVIQLVKPINLK